MELKDIDRDYEELTKNIINDRSRLQEKYDLKPLVLWEDLTIKDKVKLFSYWSLVSVITSLIQIFGALTSICST
jgi:hypothetical protein